mgnify:CR=1
MHVSVRYEWDVTKREQNLAKHGLAFNDARQVYENPFKWDFRSARVGGEERRQAFAYAPVAQAVCILVYVARADSVRCISFRRASKREREEYREYLGEDRQLHE